MHMAVALDQKAWIAENTAFCHRLSARITVDACQNNRQASARGKGDLRCAGCGGIHNQLERGAAQLQLVASPTSAGNAAELDPFTVALMSILDEKEDETEAEARVEDGEDFGDLAALNDLELDFSPEELETLCPGLATEVSLLSDPNDEAADIEPDEGRQAHRRAKKGHAPRKFAVYMGRCRKCGGYMVRGAKESHDGTTDDDVHRCYNCGWRTSPGYDYNRNHPGEGWR